MATKTAEIMECPYCFDGRKLSYVSQENEYTCKKCKNWFKPRQLDKSETKHFHISPCRDAEFEGIDCLESETQFGFSRNDYDFRPAHRLWIDKEDAIILFKLFAKKNNGN